MRNACQHLGPFMKLSLDYLRTRHEFWKRTIGDAEIWNPSLFQSVTLKIRKNHREYNALFHRRWSSKMKRIEDSIIIYNKVEDFDSVYLDSLLVHEMIHQYLIQNKLGEKRPHGKTFKEMMDKINSAFPGQLNIQVKSSNPNVSKIGSGPINHTLLMIVKEKFGYCCVIHPKKIAKFNDIARTLKNRKQIKNYSWAQSNDCYFNNFSRCMKVLHGEVITLTNFKEYCSLHNITGKEISI